MKKIFLLSVFSLFIFLGSVQIAAAADSYACQCNNGTQSKEFKCSDCATKCSKAGSTQASCVKAAATNSSSNGTELPNPLGKGTTVESLIARVINYILGLIGTISLLLFIYGGMIWMTSAGSSDKVKKGRDIIVWAVIGMAVVFMSYIAVKFVIQGLEGSL